MGNFDSGRSTPPPTTHPPEFQIIVFLQPKRHGRGCQGYEFLRQPKATVFFALLTRDKIGFFVTMFIGLGFLPKFLQTQVESEEATAPYVAPAAK